MNSADEVLVRSDGRLGHITLNRPAALNALTLGMVRAIADALTRFEADDEVAVVLIDGAGERGLCAGGDIRAIYQAHIAGDPAPITFWREEYRLNAQIADYSKPLVVFMDGIVMGGGIGVSAHASCRVVTERAALAMPEVAIGFVPDVGSTYLLSRSPGELGTYVALTAARFGAADAIDLGLADHFVTSDALPALKEALRDCRSRGDVDRSIRAFVAAPGRSRLSEERRWIDAAFSAGSIEEIEARLVAEQADGAKQALDALSGMSPSSLKVTLRALRTARGLENLKACLAMELRIGVESLRRPDLAEGIRAMIIDKDKTPRWSPRRLDDVTAEIVDAYFRDIGPDELRFS